LADLREPCSGDAPMAGGLDVHALELRLEDAVGVFGLLLLAQLHGVFALFAAAAGIGSVLTGAVGLALHPLVRAIDRLLEFPRDPGLGSCVTCHFLSFWVRPSFLPHQQRSACP